MNRSQREEAALRRKVGAAIERRRAEKGLGVDALATAAEVDLSQLVKVLKGECGLSLYSLNRLASALDCQPGDLHPPIVRPLRSPKHVHRQDG